SHAVVSPGKLTIGENRAHGRLIEDVATHARNGKGCAVPRMRIGRRQSLARSTVVAAQHAHGPRTCLPGKPQSKLGMGYIARKDKVDRAGEVIAVLQKEWTLFRKEHREALIDGDLRLVGFNLAEVRIDGRIEHETVVQDELGVQADLGLHGLAVEKRMVRVAVIDVAKAAQQSVGNELNVAGRRN